ncbi:MAG: hypothetical protein U1E67_23380 [Hyphomicrobiales bacterium]
MTVEHPCAGALPKAGRLSDRIFADGDDMKLWFENDSDLDPIHSHPRYQKLLGLAG